MPLQLRVKEIEGGKPGRVYYPLELVEVPMPTPGPDQLLIRMKAAALNHRDLFIRQHLYPAISFSSPMLADGYGVVVSAGADVSSSAPAVGQPVLLTPSRGWAADPAGPEELARFSTCGSSLLSEDSGTAVQYCVVDAREVEPAPGHLTPAEGAALPLAGLTAWRALVTKAGIRPVGEGEKKNILITGIGGGVALSALQFAVAMGHRAYVTSGDPSKLERATQTLGAAGGVSYRAPDWDAQLAALLPAERPFLDCVVDGAGGDVVKRSVRLLRAGGIIACYGMTVAPKMDWLMQAVLKNVELRGTTMGSREEFREMVAFVREHGVKPVVSRVVKGLDNLEGIEGLFEDIKGYKQFGKLVIEIAGEDESPPKL